MATIRTSAGSHEKRPRILSGLSVDLWFILLLATPALRQDWFRTGTGLVVSKARVAVADFVGSPRPQQAAGCALATSSARTSISAEFWNSEQELLPLQSPGTPPEVDFKGGPTLRVLPAFSPSAIFSASGTARDQLAE